MFYKNLMLILSSAMFVNFCMAMEPKGDFNFTAGEITKLRMQKEWSAVTEKLIKKWLEKKKNRIVDLFKFNKFAELTIKTGDLGICGFKPSMKSRMSLRATQEGEIIIDTADLKEFDEGVVDFCIAHEMGHFKHMIDREFEFKSFLSSAFDNCGIDIKGLYIDSILMFLFKFSAKSIMTYNFIWVFNGLRAKKVNSKAEMDADDLAYKMLCSTEGRKCFLNRIELINKLFVQYSILEKIGFYRRRLLDTHPSNEARIQNALKTQAEFDNHGVTKKDTSVTLTAKEASLSQQEVDQVFKIIGKSQPQGKLFKMHNNIDYLESI